MNVKEKVRMLLNSFSEDEIYFLNSIPGKGTVFETNVKGEREKFIKNC